MGLKREIVSVKACYMMIQPVIKILLKLGVSFKTFTSIAQKVYIDCVLDDENNKVSVSAIAAMTGISRKKVGDFIDIETSDLSEPTDKLAVAVVIDNWWEHLDEKGEPLHLPIVSESGLDVKTLIAGAKVDLPFSTVVKLIKKSEQIEIDDKGFFYPISRENVDAQKTTSGSILDCAASVHGYADTIYKNLFPECSERKDKLFERRARVPHMSKEEFAKFQSFCTLKLPELVIQFNEWLDENVGDCKISASPNQGFTGVGIYAFDYTEIRI
ncbi:MAG: DUF6502 family protein [Pseudomonadota bacterium]